jgi:hypothetical protein
MGAAVAHFFVDVSMSLEQLVIFGLLVVLFCVWSVALTRAWRRRHS